MLGVVPSGRIGYILFYDLKTYLPIRRCCRSGTERQELQRRPASACSRRPGGGRASTGCTCRRGRFQTPLVPLGSASGRPAISSTANSGQAHRRRLGRGFPASLPSPFSSMDATTLRAQSDAGARIRSCAILAALPGRPEGLALFAFLWWYSSKTALPALRRRRHGSRCCTGVPLRGGIRARARRAPGYLAFGWLTMGQLLQLPLIAFGLFWLWAVRRSPTLQPLPPFRTLPARERETRSTEMKHTSNCCSTCWNTARRRATALAPARAACLAGRCVRPGRRLPAGHDQEAAPALDRARAVGSAGSTNIAYLKDNKVSIWGRGADERGELWSGTASSGAAGKALAAVTIDQIEWVIDGNQAYPDHGG